MKRIQIALDFGDLTDVRIATDHVRLGQVVTNLLANAIRFTSYSSTRVITVRKSPLSIQRTIGQSHPLVPREPSAWNVQGQYGSTSPLEIPVLVSRPVNRLLCLSALSVRANPEGVAYTHRGQQDDSLEVWRLRLGIVHMPK